MKRLLYALVGLCAVVLIAGLFTSKRVYTEIEINAPADHVWQQLIAFNEYPQWNPFIIRVSGNLKTGSRLDVTIDSGMVGEMGFNLTVGAVDHGREMIWLGETLFPRLLDGRHHFRIEPLPQGRVRFLQEEFYSGLLLYPAWLFVSTDASQGFGEMNKALKQLTERDTKS